MRLLVPFVCGWVKMCLLVWIHMASRLYVLYACVPTANTCSPLLLVGSVGMGLPDFGIKQLYHMVF